MSSELSQSEPRSVVQADPNRPASAAPSEATEAESRRGHDPYLALRYRDYRLYSFGMMIAFMGNAIASVAIAWEIFDRSNSKVALGYIAGIQAIPIVLLALPAGSIADRFNRRWVAAIFTVLAAGCSMGMANYSYRAGSIPILYVILFLYACALSFARPARSAIAPMVVPLHAYANAITWNASFFQVATMAGPALGGFIIHYSLGRFGSLKAAYLVDAGCGVISAGIGLMLRTLPQTVAGAVAGKRSRLRELFAGIAFVRDTKVILATITLDLFAVLLGGAVYLLPVFAKDILRVDARGFGWLRAADAMGAFSMAILVAHAPPMKHAGRAMLLAVAAFGGATIVFGLSRSFWLSFGALFLIGAFDNISVVVRHTLVQVLTPDAMRGRVSAVNAVFIGASNELGGLESGLTAAWLGPVNSVVFGGIGTLLAVLLVRTMFPQILKIGRLDERRPLTDVS